MADDVAGRLREHLAQFASAPFLFIGAGLSRRYLGADSWEELLRRFAEPAGRPYEYFASKVGSRNYPGIATAMAETFHEVWWEDSRYDESRREFGSRVRDLASPLKYEIAKYLGEAFEDRLPRDGNLRRELDLFETVVVDGVITTNFDPLLEHIFPDLRVFVGQDGVLFSDPQGVGELYKVHGSYEDPDSLVLTADDYQVFRQRNAYLAAKLLTIFVEHPVVFLGYSLSDTNVVEILTSIASCLTRDRIAELQDRLVFVEWREGADPSMAPSVIPAGEGINLPVYTITLDSHTPVYEALNALQRKLPARILRKLKEQVYELVRDNDPNGKLYVQDLEDDTDTADIDVVFGVGTIERLTRERSYIGLSRRDLLMDVIEESDDLDAGRVVTDALPLILKGKGNVPVFKYLRGAGLLDGSGKLLDPNAVDRRIAKRVSYARNILEPPKTGVYPKRGRELLELYPTLEELIEYAAVDEVLMFAPLLDDETVDLEVLRGFLVDHRDALDSKAAFAPTQWAKCVCLYDLLRFELPQTN